ncbi:MAG: hypothetical protein MMC23_008074 [Stictis urceolatum]|nr:hypothetical protein [Stictis urceolata]
MEHVHKINPFSKREEHGNGSLLAYKVLTFLSWLLVHIVNIHFAWNAPNDKGRTRTIWGQNSAYPTPFSLNHVIVDIYWVIILFLQIAYMYHLWAGDHKVTAANVGSHFIANNLLMFGFVMLWVHGFFWIAELLLLINFANLSTLYFRHSTSPLLVHIPVVSGPLAWNFVAIFWCGAAMVNAQNLAARILANIAIWGILGYGMFFLLAFKDYTMGFELSILAASLGVHQFFIKVISLQWIFAFAIMGLLFVFTCIIALPGAVGKEFSIRPKTQVVDEDRERQPLLNDS